MDPLKWRIPANFFLYSKLEMKFNKLDLVWPNNAVQTGSALSFFVLLEASVSIAVQLSSSVSCLYLKRAEDICRDSGQNCINKRGLRTSNTRLLKGAQSSYNIDIYHLCFFFLQMFLHHIATPTSVFLKSFS